MLPKKTVPALAALASLSAGVACEQKSDKAGMLEGAFSGRLATPPPKPSVAPDPEPGPTASAQPPKPIEAPKWVEDYAAVLCKRVAVCREKMLGALPPQQKTMLAMQIPTKEACLENTRTFKERAPKTELDDNEKRALQSCLQHVPQMACAHVQTGKIPQCETIAGLISAAQGKSGSQPAAPTE